MKKVEDEIHRLETRDGEIDGLLCDESVFSDVAKLMELNREKRISQGNLRLCMKSGRSWLNKQQSLISAESQVRCCLRRV